MKDYGLMFRNNAMAFRTAFMLMSNMARELSSMKNDKDVDDFGAVLYNSPMIAIRHIDPAELFDIQNFALLGKCLDAFTNVGDDLMERSKHNTPVVIIARQWFDLLSKLGVTENGGQWLVKTIEKALDSFDEDTPVGNLKYASIKITRTNGEPIKKQKLSDMCFDVYPDEETKLKDLHADGFLPLLMPWLENIGEWRVFPNGTAMLVRRIDRLGMVRDFLEQLKKHCEFLYEAFMLKDTDAETYARKIGNAYMRYGRRPDQPHHTHGTHESDYDGQGKKPMFARFGESYSARRLRDEKEKAQDKTLMDERTYAICFLTNPVISSSGKRYPNFDKPTRLNGNVIDASLNKIKNAELGVQFGILDADTLEIKINPKTGRHYTPADYDKETSNSIR